MGGEKDKKPGGATAGAELAPTPATPGKSTQPGTPEGASPDDAAENDKNQRPPRYLTLDIDIVDLLAKSKASFLSKLEGATPTTPFWKLVDLVSGPTMQTLVQVHKAASTAGVWGLIGPLEDVYTFGTSWGLEYQPATDAGGILTGGAWGKDFPQGPVQDEHGAHGKDYIWYRQNTGPGAAGLHMGVGNGKKNNLHIDPTNPMDHVSTGIEMGPMGIPIYIPSGCAVYSPAALAAHLKDIWNIGDPVEHEATPQPFLSISQLDYCAKVGCEIADLEQTAKVKPENVGRRDAACAQIKAARAPITALQPKSRALAMQDTGKNKAAVNALKTEFLAARHQLFDGLAKLFAHVTTDVEGIMPNNRKLQKEADWDERTNMMGYAMDKYKEYAYQRKWNDPNTKADDLL